MQGREPFIVNWHRKPDRSNNKPRKKATEQAESISAPVKSRKGKHRAIDDDPIDVFDDFDDMYYDDPDVSLLATASSDTLASSLSAPGVITASSSTSSSATLVDTTMVKTEEMLYKEMLVLRKEVTFKFDLSPCN
jgi:hypothetical protein